MPVTVVNGAQWGDEGKGKIVDHLAERATMVVRYQGGNNAGHTVIIGDTVLKLHQVPSGVTRPEVAAVMGHGMVVNPPALVEELDTLESQGMDTSNLFISCNAHVVMPYHLLLDGLEEERRGAKSLGTTKKGIGPAYKDKYARSNLRMQDLRTVERFRNRVSQVIDRVNAELTLVFGHDPLTVDEIVDAYAPAIYRLSPHITDTTLLIQQALDRGEKVLMEGAQATMLDIDYGTYPFVTSSNPSAGGACVGAGVNPRQIKEIVGVVKAYTSRVGAGPFPTELFDEIGDWIVETGHEYGTTTGRRRRCGWIDTVCLRYAARINGYTGLAITRLDILTGLDEINICVGYRLPDGSETTDYPLDTELLAQVEPIYETMPGWTGDLSAVRSFEELPENAAAYCRRLVDLLGVPADLISVGAERSDLIALRWPI